MLRAPLFALLGTAAILAAFAMIRAMPEPEPAITVADHRPVRIVDAPAEMPAETEVAAAQAIAAPAVVVVDPPRAVRDVTPTDMTAGPIMTGALPRVEPEPAPIVAEAPAAAAPAEARTKRVFNPVIPAAGIIRIGDRDIRLDGIEAPGAEATCGANAWPCGAMARAALRRFIRGRAIDCEVPAGASAVPDTASCSVAGEDLSRWLMAQGWAEATGEAYIGIEIGAREDRFGMWAAGRPDAHATAEAAASLPESAAAMSPLVSATP